MEIFIDSADIDEIKQAYAWGIADGVTTNPSLIKKAVEKRKQMGQQVDMKSYIEEILRVAGETPVSLEVTKATAEGMIMEGKKLHAMFNHIADNVVIKIPINPAFRDEDMTHADGIKAISALAAEGIRTNCTLIFTPEQALLAARAGATFVSPFAGRMDDFIRTKGGMMFNKTDYYPEDGDEKDGVDLEDNGIVSGIDLVEKCAEIMKDHELETEVLAASLRNVRQVREAALAGAHVATLPLGVIRKMLQHPKTYEGMEKFTADVIEEYANL